MDKNTVTGLLLIFLITMAWAWYTMPSEEELEQQRQEEMLRQDSLAALQQQNDTLTVNNEGQETTAQQSQDRTNAAQTPAQESRQMPELREPGETALGIFSQDSADTDTIYTTVRTPLFELEFTNLGAGPSRVIMQEHETWDHNPVQMVRNTTRSAYSLGFLSTENLNIETDRLFFEPVDHNGPIEISEGETAQLSYRLAVNESSALLFTYTFNGDSYIYDLDITFENMSPLISGTIVDFGWKSALNYTERDLVQDKMSTAAYTYAGGVLEKFQLESAGRNEQTINGTIEWVSTRTRFFGQYIKPVTNSNASVMIGEVTGEPGQPGTMHYYQSRVQSSVSGTPTLSYELYNGPLKYYDLKEFHEHAYDVVEIGYALIRWFADPLVRYV
ncbi:MAG: membrane protein insertase YidC, partial [Balneolaceae bacterium]|nr:membrane protein insertase YidC [Balneolaceae bacterium]